MKIEWMKEDVARAWTTWRTRTEPHVPEQALDDAMQRVMSEAVSIFLARASGQVKEDEERVVFGLAQEGGAGLRGVARESLSRLSALAQEAESLRAKVAELEKTQRGAFCLEQAKLRESAEDARGSLRAEVDRLKAEVTEIARQNQSNLERENLREYETGRRERMIKALTRERDEAKEETELADEGRKRWKGRSVAAESRLAAIRERGADSKSISRFAQRVDAVTWVLEGDATQEAKEDAVSACARFEHCEGGDHDPVCPKSKRYPCSPTCTHDDAATPGHPERVRLLSGEVAKVTGLEGTLTDELRPITLKSGARVTPKDAPHIGAARRMFEAERAKMAERVKHMSEAVIATLRDPMPETEESAAAVEAGAESDAYELGADTVRTAVEKWARGSFGEVPPTLKDVLDGAV